MRKISAKKAIFILMSIALVLVIALYFLAKDQKQINYKTFKVTKGDIIQTVSETGTVKANSEIDLSFLS
ncbi:hypothetical protein C0583_02150 [Candidatus Parcubacteria bacterium]|nr:MAG: hypothetical protein C0583_02150 [Candidatus Parcubacteria bacterium]